MQTLAASSQIGVVRRSRNTRSCVVLAQTDAKVEKAAEKPWYQSITPVVAAALAVSLAVGGLAPMEAEAARSGGRMGGGSFRSAPRAAPRTVPRAGGATVNNYNMGPSMVAPPLFSPFGFGGFGMPFGGFGIGMPMFIGGGSSIFTLMIVMVAVSTVMSTIQNQVNQNKKDKFDDDEY